MTNTTLTASTPLIAGIGRYATKTTLQINTTGYSIHSTLVTNQKPYGAHELITIYAATSSVSVSADQAALQFRRVAAYIETFPPPNIGDTITVNFPLLARLGDYLYCWCDVPTLPVDASIALQLWENA